MKKLFMSMMSLVALVGLFASCSDENMGANEVEVTFTVSMEELAGSRAYADGTTAKELVFAVFDHTIKNENGTIAKYGEELPKMRQTSIEFDAELKATVSTKLIKGKTYDFVFWAQPKDSKAFDITDMDSIKVIYNQTTLLNNNEELDAFLHAENNVKITGPLSMNVTLTRPFAQLNFATTKEDWETALNAGLVREGESVTSQITVTGGIFGTLNTREGKVADPIEKLVFQFTTIPSGENEWLPRVDALKQDATTGEMVPGQDGKYEDYRWLAMTYVLVNETQMATKLVMDITSPTVVNDITIANAPMQRNYRTNILGDLLTVGAIFNVTIDPVPVNDHNEFYNK